ncbi:MAG: hypothetical protein M3271_00850 [Actinomycetota bacterium]|nr:hypothetical protein [Actinomycetota bacterium]
MSTDLRLTLANRPGTLANACAALAAAGVKVEGACGDIRPGDRWGYVHLLVDDATTANEALGRAGLEVSGEHEVELVDVPPGDVDISAIVSRFTGADRNVEVFYPTLDGRIAISTEDMRKDRLGVKMSDTRY